MKRILSSFVVLFIIWIALAGVSLPELLLGGIVCMVLSIIFGKTLAYNFGLGVVLSTIKFVFLYIPLFIVKLIQSNISLAKIVLNPKLPINPGFVRISTGIESDVGRLILANSITLTPGTLTIDVKEHELLIHWVDVIGTEENTYFKHIASDFEKVLGGIVE